MCLRVCARVCGACTTSLMRMCSSPHRCARTPCPHPSLALLHSLQSRRRPRTRRGGSPGSRCRLRQVPTRTWCLPLHLLLLTLPLLLPLRSRHGQYAPVPEREGLSGRRHVVESHYVSHFAALVHRCENQDWDTLTASQHYLYEVGIRKIWFGTGFRFRPCGSPRAIRNTLARQCKPVVRDSFYFPQCN